MTPETPLPPNERIGGQAVDQKVRVGSEFTGTDHRTKATGSDDSPQPRPSTPSPRCHSTGTSQAIAFGADLCAAFETALGVAL